MGLGVALAVLLGVCRRQFGVGIGIGGGLAILGLAAFINGALHAGDDRRRTRAPLEVARDLRCGAGYPPRTAR